MSVSLHNYVRFPCLGMLAALLTVSGCAGPRVENVDDTINSRAKEVMSDSRVLSRGCSVGGSEVNQKSVSWMYPNYDFANHFVVSDSDGRIRNNGRSARATADALIRGIVSWNNHVKKGDEKRLARVVFYFNGGLNQEEAIIDQAANQIPCMLADGVFPVFFVWDTNGTRSYFEQAFFVRDGQLDRERQVVTGSAYMLGDIIEGFGRAPSDYFVHGSRYVNSVAGMRPCYDEVVAADDNNPNCSQDQKVGIVPLNGEPSVTNYAVIDRHRINAPHKNIWEEIQYGAFWPIRMLTTPFADGLGQATFTNYLRRTRTTVRKPIELYWNRNNDKDVVPCPQNLAEDMDNYPEGTGAFAKIVKMLNIAHGTGTLPNGKWRCMGDYEEPQPLSPPIPEIAEFPRVNLAVTMIGHSMGAIVVNELVSKLPDALPYTDLVYMAAAAGADRTRDSVQPLLKKGDVKLFNLVLHPLNDARERYAKGTVPSGSLLMWVDEMYQQAGTPDGKTFGYWPNAKATRIIFDKDVKDQMLYRVFSRPPVNKQFCTGTDCVAANPTTHGGFNDDNMCFWRPAFWGATATKWKDNYSDLPPWALRECQSYPVAN